MARRASKGKIPFYVKVCAFLIVVGGDRGGKRSERASWGGLEESVSNFGKMVSWGLWARQSQEKGVPVV